MSSLMVKSFPVCFLDGDSHMLKPLQTACLTGAGFLVLAASVGGQYPAAAPFLLAMQEPQTTSHEGAQRPSLSKVGWIGLILEDGKGQEVRVKGLFPGGPAAFAGVRAGDVLARIGGNAADSVAAATAAIESLVPQRQTTLTIRRQGKPLELKVTVESLGEFRADYVQEMLPADPRDRQYAQHHGISDADMSVSSLRRLFEQHERFERTLQQEVLDEVHALRKEVRSRKSDTRTKSHRFFNLVIQAGKGGYMMSNVTKALVLSLAAAAVLWVSGGAAQQDSVGGSRSGSSSE